MLFRCLIKTKGNVAVIEIINAMLSAINSVRTPELEDNSHPLSLPHSVVRLHSASLGYHILRDMDINHIY